MKRRVPSICDVLILALLGVLTNGCATFEPKTEPPQTEGAVGAIRWYVTNYSGRYNGRGGDARIDISRLVTASNA